MSRWRFSRRNAALGAAILAASGIVFAGWTLWRASRALSDAGQQLRGASVIRFTSKAITPVIPAGFGQVAAPAVFTDAAVFQGPLYTAAPARLHAHHSQ